MDKPAPKPIALPPISQHLREFVARRDAWSILARNLVPVVGVYGLGWSYAVTAFSYWFDGVVGILAYLVVSAPCDVRHARAKGQGKPGFLRRFLISPLAWTFVFALVATPYWMVVILIPGLFTDTDLAVRLLHDHGLWIALGVMVAMNFWNAFHAGYADMPKAEYEERSTRDVRMLFVRGLAMAAIASGIFAIFLVPLLALALTYIEVWPARALGLVFRDRGSSRQPDPDAPE